MKIFEFINQNDTSDREMSVNTIFFFILFPFVCNKGGWYVYLCGFALIERFFSMKSKWQQCRDERRKKKHEAKYKVHANRTLKKTTTTTNKQTKRECSESRIKYKK